MKSLSTIAVVATVGFLISCGSPDVSAAKEIIHHAEFQLLQLQHGEKWAKEELVTPFFGVWLANFVLLPFGLFFLRQARLDARIFETDFYSVIIDQLKSKIPDKFKNPKRFVLFNR